MAPNRRKPQLEVRCRVDDAWYDGDVTLEGTKLRTHFNSFGSEEDEIWDVEWLVSASRIEDLMRLRSKQLQDVECTKVSAGMIVCANYKVQDGSESKYYDAKVLKVHHNKHAFPKQRAKQELCKCRFVVIWEAGPQKYQEADLGCGEISLISTEDVAKHPVGELLLRGVQSRTENLGSKCKDVLCGNEQAVSPSKSDATCNSVN